MKLPLLLLMACTAFGSDFAFASDPVVLSHQEVPRGDHKVIFERIVPPVDLTVSAKSEGVSSGRQKAPSNESVFPRRLLSLSCTVYGREFTEVRWRGAGGEEYVIWSSLDLTYLMGRSSGGFLHEGVKYDLFLGLGEAQAEDTAAALEVFRATPHRKTQGSWYVVRKMPAEVPEDAFDGINALHHYFDANKAAIIAEHEQMKAANAARVAFEKKHPPVKKDTVIRFWPLKSVLHGAEPAEVQEPKKEVKP